MQQSTAPIDPDAIRSRIDQARAQHRRAVVAGLVQASSAGAGAGDEAELRQLQDIDERLREETIELEMLKQHVAQNLRDVKGEELKKMSLETEQDLAALERQREAMLLEMDRKQVEVDLLRQDLRLAEQRLAPRWEATDATSNRILSGISGQEKESQLIGLAHIHAASAAKHSAEREQLLRSAAEIEINRRVPSGMDTTAPITQRGPNSIDVFLRTSGEGETKPAPARGEALDRLVCEAEALLRQHRYDHHDVLRRLDLSRNIPPGTAADSVNSLAGPPAASAGRRMSVGSLDTGAAAVALPALSTPPGYVSTRDTLDKWLVDNKEKTSTASIDLAEALHLNGKYSQPLSDSHRDAFSPLQPRTESTLLRSQSATSDKSSFSRAGRAVLREAPTSGHLEHFDQSPRHDGPRDSEAVAARISVRQSPSQQSPQPEFFPARRNPAQQRPYVPDHNEPRNWQRGMNAQHSHPQDLPLRHPQIQEPTHPAQFVSDHQIMHWNNPSNVAQYSRVPQGMYPPADYPVQHSYLQPSASAYHPGVGYASQVLRNERDHSSVRPRSRERRRETDDSSPRQYVPSVGENNEVAIMKARMKALADELEAENTSLRASVSTAKGESVLPAGAGASRSDGFRHRDDDAQRVEMEDSQILQGKRRIDEILSKQVDFQHSLGASNRRSRVTEDPMLQKEKNKCETELAKMRLEMDMLRQRAALEELKAELEAQRAQRTAEKEHEDWLRGKKHRLQAIRVQKALSTEQKQFDNDMAALGIEQVDEYLSPDRRSAVKSAPRESASLEIIRPEDSGPFEFCIDGLIVPSANYLDGDSMRVVIGFVGADDGSMIGRLMSSDWQPCTKSVQRGRFFKRTQSELTKLHAENEDGAADSIAARVGATAHVMCLHSCLVKRASAAEHELMQLSHRGVSNAANRFCSQLRMMVEVQVRNGPQGVPKGAGWCTLDPSQMQWNPGAASGSVLSSDAALRFPRYGKWRASLLAGVADPTFLSTQRILDNEENLELSAANSMWLLFRINRISPSATLSNPVQTILEQDTSSKAAWTALVEYKNFSHSDLSALQRHESVQSLQSVQSIQSQPATQPLQSGQPSRSPTAPRTASSTASGRPPPTAATARSTRTVDTAANAKTPVSTKLSVGLDVISAINEMKHLRDIHQENDKQAKVGFFELGSPTGLATHKYLKDDGIDVYVDGARFLPNNATVTRCVVKMFTSEWEPIPISRSAAVICAYSDINSDAGTPSYQTKAECRASVFNCTATLLFRIDTLDASTLQCAGVGYAALRVFCTKDRAAISLPNDPSAYVNTGKFQLPLYAGRVQTGGTFNDTVLADGMPRIPCASILVRIVAAPKSSDGLATLSCTDVAESDWASLGVMVPAPDYSSGQYDGKLCQPNADELMCYSAKLGEKSSQHSGSSSVKGLILRVLSTHSGHSLPPAPEG